MKNFKISLIFGLMFGFLLFSCEKSDEGPAVVIDGLTAENYPKVDCSTSAGPLQTIIYCELLGLDYSWRRNMALDNVFYVHPDIDDYSSFSEKTSVSGTHGAYMSLINKESDLILVAREPSGDELDAAGLEGVELEITPVALDAFIFIVNTNNPVKSLTTSQIKDIYKNNITNWKEVGGNDSPINPYVRNANSGSQELMETLVMKGEPMADWTEAILSGMSGPFSTLRFDENGLCYTVYYYKEQMVRDQIVKHLSVDGVYPDKKTIKNQSYPYTTFVYAVVRQDLNRTSMAFKVYEALQTKGGKRMIEKSGYIAN
ncbi:MAG: substrate-binding domain-containing protein [Mariniphaga sp.]|nr:substrate-binding domain-containing protein [Mariniphaga sp.]